MDIRKSIKLQLAISATVVFIVAFIYGANPSQIMPYIFDFEVKSTELKNIFRAIMGLYLAFSLYWFYCLNKPKKYFNATLSTILFMGGLAFGRIISLILDGISIQYSIGILLELLMMSWGVYNIRNLKKT